MVFFRPHSVNWPILIWPEGSRSRQRVGLNSGLTSWCPVCQEGNAWGRGYLFVGWLVALRTSPQHVSASHSGGVGKALTLYRTNMKLGGMSIVSNNLYCSNYDNNYQKKKQTNKKNKNAWPATPQKRILIWLHVLTIHGPRLQKWILLIAIDT